MLHPPASQSLQTSAVSACSKRTSRLDRRHVYSFHSQFDSMSMQLTDLQMHELTWPGSGDGAILGLLPCTAPGRRHLLRHTHPALRWRRACVVCMQRLRLVLGPEICLCASCVHHPGFAHTPGHYRMPSAEP